MGITRSIGVTATQGSVGIVTYRTVRGRTISSQKVGARPLTRSAAMPANQKLMSEKQMSFGLSTRYARMHAADIMVSFDKTKLGSQRNRFVKLNAKALAEAFADLYEDIGLNDTDTMAISDQQIETAVSTYATSNPQAIYRVYRSGYAVKYLSGAWVSTDNPEEAPDIPSGGGGQGGTGTGETPLG